MSFSFGHPDPELLLSSVLIARYLALSCCYWNVSSLARLVYLPLSPGWAG